MASSLLDKGTSWVPDSIISQVADKKQVGDPENILDSEWTKNAFMVPATDIANKDDVANRYWSTANAKYVDSRLGCNIGINPRPQLCPYADIRVKDRLDRSKVSYTSADGNYGAGRAHSEMFDDPDQRIYLRFGVPQFNSLSTFLSQAFSTEQIVFARTGRAPSGWYKLGVAVGTVVPLIAFPALTLTVMVGRAMNWMFSRPTSKFFTIKPTMHLYWGMVNNLVNNHAVNTGIFQRVFNDSNAQNSQRLGSPYKLDAEQMKAISEAMPDIFNGHGFFDCYALANRAQRLANQMFEKDYAALEKGTATNFIGYLRRENTTNGTHSTYISDGNSNASLSAFLNKFVTFGTYISETGPDKKPSMKQETDIRVDPKGEPGKQITDESHFQQMKQYADAEFRDGSAFAIFRVDHTGSVSESFGNSVVESDLSKKLNGVSNQLAESRFTFADGNVLSGMAGELVEGAVKSVADFAMGAVHGVTLGFDNLVMGLAGSGYIDVPKHWDGSNVNLPRGSYSIQLISPYNNPISRMINIWIPFYMLLAGIMPRSTGKQSYTHPFYCQLFDRGRVQSRTAMMESFTAVRGTSNLPFDTYGNALAIDVNFTVVDLSSIMHMPMSSNGLLETDMTIDDDNIAMDYLSVLAGMDIYSQIYPLSKAQLKLTKELVKLKGKFYSAAYHTAMFKNAMDSNFFGRIATSTIEGIVRGNAGAEGPLR